MIYPKPKNMKLNGDEWCFTKTMTLCVSEKYTDEKQLKLFVELYKNFTGGVGKLRIRRLHSNVLGAVFSADGYEPKESKDLHEEYAIAIETGKAELFFSDKISFSHAFCTLLKLIEVRSTKSGRENFTLPIGQIEDSPALSFRGLHLCVFPETSFIRMRKFVRLAGFLGYSHIVLEFWGMFPYKSEKALGRKNAYKLRQIRALASDAEALGTEIIPMLNIFGHASQDRMRYGKHVALEQNPRLAPYFETCGWNWNLVNPETEILQKKLIDELLDICGKGKYFCIGCDEAYAYAVDRQYSGKDEIQILIDHINLIVDYLKSKNRSSIMWADMLLCRDRFPGSVADGLDSKVCEKLLDGLKKEIILADWQYWTKDEALPTSCYLSERGFRIITVPWDDSETAMICLRNVEKCNYFGYMQSTWHTISQNFFQIPVGAVYAWEGSEKASQMPLNDCVLAFTARYLRCMKRVRRYEDEGIRLQETDA